MKADWLSRIAFSEHLAVKCELDLQDFCVRLQTALSLPEFKYDAENATEWGLVEVENVEYNVSRPYDPGTLHDWDESVPPGCNFGISLMVYREHAHADNQEWSYGNLVAPVGQIISNEFGIDVHYHRTWLGVGQNVERKITFHPGAAYR
jgi:hypothetical protein